MCPSLKFYAVRRYRVLSAELMQTFSGKIMPPIPDNELEITFVRSGGPGGQHRNVTETAVRVRHIPTDITVIAKSSRSQHRNKLAAIAEIERRLALRRRRRKPRVPTGPSKAARQRRIDSKKRRGAVKQARKPPKQE